MARLSGAFQIPTRDIPIPASEMAIIRLGSILSPRYPMGKRARPLKRIKLPITEAACILVKAKSVK